MKVEKVSLGGIGIGLLSLGFPFLTLKPNRLAQGSAFSLWNVLPPVEIFVLLLPWIVLIALVLIISERPFYPLLVGVVANVAVLTVFLLVGRSAERLMIGQEPFARVSMSFGSWGLVGASYILIIDAFQKARAYRPGRFLIAFSGLLAVLLLLSTGYLKELSILKEYAVRKDRFLLELGKHVTLSGVAVLLAVVIGTPLGVLAFRRRLLERPIFFVVNSIQTIPSLALFGIMIAPLSVLSYKVPFLREMGVKGIGSTPALIALTLYALLPITRNTYTSLKVIDPAILDSAKGMGMNRLELLLTIQLPLSIPIILSGIRVSMVQAIGNTTVAALIGAGGFGVFVFQGLGQAAFDLILLGTIPVIVLAIFTDKIMQLLVTLLTPEGLKKAGEILR